MRRVNIAEAKAHFSEYIRDVKNGEALIICERNVPVVELRPYDPHRQEPSRRVLGRWDGQTEYDESIFAPMTDDEVAAFEDDPANPLNQP